MYATLLGVALFSADNGIDRDQILKHMTTESNTVILFDDKGAVVSTADPRVVMAMISATGIVPKFGVMAAKRHLADVRAMKGHVMAAYSAIGRGNRFTKDKAETLLDDLIKEQSK